MEEKQTEVGDIQRVIGKEIPRALTRADLEPERQDVSLLSWEMKRCMTDVPSSASETHISRKFAPCQPPFKRELVLL